MSHVWKITVWKCTTTKNAYTYSTSHKVYVQSNFFPGAYLWKLTAGRNWVLMSDLCFLLLLLCETEWKGLTGGWCFYAFFMGRLQLLCQDLIRKRERWIGKHGYKKRSQLQHILKIFMYLLCPHYESCCCTGICYIHLPFKVSTKWKSRQQMKCFAEICSFTFCPSN